MPPKPNPKPDPKPAPKLADMFPPGELDLPIIPPGRRLSQTTPAWASRWRPAAVSSVSPFASPAAAATAMPILAPPPRASVVAPPEPQPPEILARSGLLPHLDSARRLAAQSAAMAQIREARTRRAAAASGQLIPPTRHQSSVSREQRLREILSRPGAITGRSGVPPLSTPIEEVTSDDDEAPGPSTTGASADPSHPSNRPAPHRRSHRDEDDDDDEELHGSGLTQSKVAPEPQLPPPVRRPPPKPASKPGFKPLPPPPKPRPKTTTVPVPSPTAVPSVVPQSPRRTRMIANIDKLDSKIKLIQKDLQSIKTSGQTDSPMKSRLQDDLARLTVAHATESAALAALDGQGSSPVAGPLHGSGLSAIYLTKPRTNVASQLYQQHGGAVCNGRPCICGGLCGGGIWDSIKDFLWKNIHPVGKMQSIWEGASNRAR